MNINQAARRVTLLHEPLVEKNRSRPRQGLDSFITEILTLEVLERRKEDFIVLK